MSKMKYKGENYYHPDNEDWTVDIDNILKENQRLKDGHEEILTCDSTTAVWVIQGISKRAISGPAAERAGQ